jgi:DNA-binding XRE family transcriptional regulator
MLRSTRLLIAARALAGMTQSELAAAAGIALSVLQAIEQGKSDPKLSTVLALLDVLKAVGVELVSESMSVAWGVVVVTGSVAESAGRVQPSGAQPQPVGVRVRGSGAPAPTEKRGPGRPRGSKAKG